CMCPEHPITSNKESVSTGIQVAKCQSCADNSLLLFLSITSSVSGWRKFFRLPAHKMVLRAGVRTVNVSNSLNENQHERVSRPAQRARSAQTEPDRNSVVADSPGQSRTGRAGPYRPQAAAGAICRGGSPLLA